MIRRRAIPAFKAAAEIGSFEDVALIPEDVDPQVELSRNTIPQPFCLIIDEDTVLAQMSGRAHVEMKYSTVNSFRTQTGDNIYVPAGTPHRIVPVEESVFVRYTSNEPVRRGAAFFCEQCGNESYRLEWIHEGAITPRLVYAAAIREFNDTDRLCSSCGTLADAISLESLGWAD
jgi:hypothetical protein